MGHIFNCCHFVDDRLRHLLREEVMNVRQPNLQTTTTILLSVSILGTQAMNPSICCNPSFGLATKAKGVARVRA